MKLKLAPVVVLNRISLRQVSRMKVSRFGERCHRRLRWRYGGVVRYRDALNLCDAVENALEKFLADPRTEGRDENESPTVICCHLEKKIVKKCYKMWIGFWRRLLSIHRGREHQLRKYILYRLIVAGSSNNETR